MDGKENRELLHGDEFDEIEVSRLRELRSAYVENVERQNSADYRRLEFVRWLVSTGRLSDHIAQ